MKYEKLNVYLSNLAVINIKLHNLHWNVVGTNFVQLHEFTEEQYNDVFSKFDDVAELIKQQGKSPLVKLSEYLAKATIKELDEKNFSTEEVLNIVNSDLKELLSIVEDIRKIADDEDDYQTVSMMEDHASSYKKTLWFIRQMVA